MADSSAAGPSTGLEGGDKIVEPEQLMELGQAALESGELEVAIQHFGAALEQLNSKHGEMAPECARAYYLYGRALFAKAQDESGPLGQKAERAVEQLEDDGAAHAKATPQQERDAKEDVKGKGKSEAEEEAEKEESEEDDGEEGEEELEDDEEGDDALAWQMLETAKCILSGAGSRSLLEVDVLSALADISLERERFDECMADYQQAMDALRSIVAPHHRRVIELFFKMALANQMADRPAEALQLCERAIEACGDRSAWLQRVRRGDAGGSAEASAAPSNEAADLICASSSEADVQAEIEDIAALTKELQEKADELREMARVPIKSLVMAELFGRQPAGAGSSGIRIADAGGSAPATAAGGDSNAAGGSSGPESIGTAGGAGGVAGKRAAVEAGCVPVVGRGKKRLTPMPVPGM